MRAAVVCVFVVRLSLLSRTLLALVCFSVSLFACCRTRLLLFLWFFTLISLWLHNSNAPERPEQTELRSASGLHIQFHRAKTNLWITAKQITRLSLYTVHLRFSLPLSPCIQSQIIDFPGCSLHATSLYKSVRARALLLIFAAWFVDCLYHVVKSRLHAPHRFRSRFRSAEYLISCQTKLIVFPLAGVAAIRFAVAHCCIKTQ